MVVRWMLRWAGRAAPVVLAAALAACGGAEASAKAPDMGSTTVTGGAPGPQALAEKSESKPGDADESLDQLGSESLSRREVLASKDSSGMLAQNQPPAPPPAPGQPPPAGKKQPPAEPTTPRKPETASDVAKIQSPMLIYSADITMAVFEVKKALAEVEILGRDVGGFLARRDDLTITIRVPAARFDEAVQRLEKMGDMIHRNVTAEDVTEEFHDLEVRLKSARAVRERLEQLLGKAAKVEESVLIERELERVSGEIERIEGRMKFLKDRAAYSTITVRFQARAKEVVGASKFNLPVPWLYQLGLQRLLSL